MPRILYASFDEVPAPKGASTHIVAVVQALGARYGDVRLVTPGVADRPAERLFEGVVQTVVACPDDNPIGRARTFQARLARIATRESFDVIHFRSPWEGLALVDPALRRGARLVYEVNGFPSIELKYHYRRLIDDPYLLEKLRQQEQICLLAADRIVTVSQVNGREILARGVPAERIEVIPNGVDTDAFGYQPPAMVGPDDCLQVAYFGTLAVWQGLDTLIEAIALANRDRPVALQIRGSGSRDRIQALGRLAERLEVADRVQLLPAGSQHDVLRLLHGSHVMSVPLLPVDRNLQQGCCPLKLLEAMAAGTPVIASDLPVVHELGTADEHFQLARAGDARSLKNGLLRLAADGETARRMSVAARAHVVANLTWQRSLDRLLHVYENLCALSRTPRVRPLPEGSLYHTT